MFLLYGRAGKVSGIIQSIAIYSVDKRLAEFLSEAFKSLALTQQFLFLLFILLNKEKK